MMEKKFSRLALAAAAIAIVAVVGIADYLTGYELAFSIFYLVPVVLMAWFVGRSMAVGMAILSVAVSLVGDCAAGVLLNRFVLYWNATIVLGGYLIVVWLLTRLRILHLELEERVRHRTAALTAEMTERERLEKELLEISEGEQRRIGYDLHDSLCQHLIATALAGQVLEEKLAARALREAADAHRVVQLIEDGIDLTRTLARGLHPVELETEGLIGALTVLAANISERFRITCELQCPQPILFHDAAAALHVYRIVQEAVSNAIKHGGAQRVVIALAEDEHGTTLTVTDDGRGLAEATRQGAGMGLRNMAHRASMIGGRFDIQSNAPRGVVVRCCFQNPSS